MEDNIRAAGLRKLSELLTYGYAQRGFGVLPRPDTRVQVSERSRMHLDF